MQEAPRDSWLPLWEAAPLSGPQASPRAPSPGGLGSPLSLCAGPMSQTSAANSAPSLRPPHGICVPLAARGCSSSVARPFSGVSRCFWARSRTGPADKAPWVLVGREGAPLGGSKGDTGGCAARDQPGTRQDAETPGPSELGERRASWLGWRSRLTARWPTERLWERPPVLPPTRTRGQRWLLRTPPATICLPALPCPSSLQGSSF